MGTAFLIVFLFGLVGFAALMGILSLYNALASARAVSQVAFSQIEGDLIRRHEFVGGLVDNAKGPMRPERPLLEAILESRSQAASALNKVLSNPSDSGLMLALFHAEAALEKVIERLRTTGENYPDFKNGRNVVLIFRELDSLTERIALLIKAYNDSATAFNLQRKAFPSVILAGFLGFLEIPLLGVPEAPVADPEPHNSDSGNAGGRSSTVFYG